MTTTVLAAIVSVTMWKGEVCGFRIKDKVVVGEAPAGIEARMGTLKLAQYEPQPGGRQVAYAYDRIDFGQGGGGYGPKYLSLRVSREMKAGVYTFGDVEVRVLDRTLPPAKEWNYYLDLWQHPAAVARWNNKEPFSVRHYDVMRPLWKDLASLGQKSLTVTIVDRPWNHQCQDAYPSMVRHIKCADGSWKFDYKVFDRFVGFGRAQGVGPDIACYTLCPWNLVLRWEDEQGKEHAERAPIGGPLFRDYWGAFLEDFAKHLKEKGWFQDAIIAMDERSPADMKIIADFVREKAPGLRIQLAGNRKPSDFKGIDIDVYSQILTHVTPEFLKEAAERRAQGKKTTFYVCCSPDRPNTFVDSNPDEAFWIGFAPAALGLDGFLRWAYNSWPLDPNMDMSYGSWRAGDTYLVYPDGSWSMRLFDLFDGIQQAVKFDVLSKDPARADALKKVAARFDVQEAVRGTANFRALRNEVHRAVND